jgi:hypothetical protein
MLTKYLLEITSLILHIMALPESEVTDLLVCAKASITRFNSSALVLTSLHTPGVSHVPEDSSPKELGQVTSMAKQPNPSAHSNGLKNVD